MNNTLENALRERMNTFATEIRPGNADVPAARLEAARLDRRRTRAVAAGSALALAVVAVGVTAGVRHGSSKTLHPSGTPAASALPGLAPLAAVTLPANYAPSDVSEDGGQIWVTGTQYTPRGDAGDTLALHGAPGTALTPLPVDGGLVQSAVVEGALAYDTASVDGSSLDYLQVRNAATGAVLRQSSLKALYGMDTAHVTATGDGTGPVVVVMQKELPDHTGAGPASPLTRVGVVESDGALTHVTPPVHLGTQSYRIGDSAGGALSPLVDLQDGAPTYLFYFGQRIDLQTGARAVVAPQHRAGATSGGIRPSAIGELDGRVVWDTGGLGTQAAPATSLKLAAVGPVPPPAPAGALPGEFLTLADGHLFRATSTQDELPYEEGKAPYEPIGVEELDPSTLQPTGATGQLGAMAVADGRTYAAYAPGQVRSMRGGTLTVYAPIPPAS